MDNIVRGVLYYPYSMVLGQFFCRFTGSEAQTHCARRPQLVSNKFLEEEIFAGTNFRELAFDHENRENFPLYGIQVNTLSPLLPQNGVQKVGWRMCILLKIPNISDFSQ